MILYKDVRYNRTLAAPGSICEQLNIPEVITEQCSESAGRSPAEWLCTCSFMLFRIKCGLISSYQTSQSFGNISRWALKNFAG